MLDNCITRAIAKIFTVIDIQSMLYIRESLSLPKLEFITETCRKKLSFSAVLHAFLINVYVQFFPHGVFCMFHCVCSVVCLIAYLVFLAVIVLIRCDWLLCAALLTIVRINKLYLLTYLYLSNCCRLLAVRTRAVRGLASDGRDDVYVVDNAHVYRVDGPLRRHQRPAQGLSNSICDCRNYY